MKNDTYVIGVDYGTGSVRALLINAINGNEIAVSEFEYPRWKKGLYCNPSKNQFRQHPLDYIEGLEYTIKSVVSKVGIHNIYKIKAISIGTTGSTTVAVDENGTPLSLKKGFENNPNAMFFLWKDHTAIKEAVDINLHSKKFDKDYLKCCGGIYSPEWFWAKALYVLRSDNDVANACTSWVEHCDWIPFLLTGGLDVRNLKRGICSAGHKALWTDEYNGLPEIDFFLSLDPAMKKLEHPLFTEIHNTDNLAGTLCSKWAVKLGLSTNVLIGIGSLDAHMGAVGGQIEPYYLSKVMGTSTCDMMIASIEDNIGQIHGICGQVNGSIVPGMIGFEAGQSAFGDVYAWFEELLTATTFDFIEKSYLKQDQKNLLKQEISKNLLNDLGEKASKLPLSEAMEISIDWFNGRRSPDANPNLKGAILNLNLGSDAIRIYRALVEGTCYGAKRIVEHFEENGISLKGIIALGGVARKSTYIMQLMSNILGLPIKVQNAEQTCALGAAMFAATIAGEYSNVQDAMISIGKGFQKIYYPDRNVFDLYTERYDNYKAIGSFIDSKSIYVD